MESEPTRLEVIDDPPPGPSSFAAPRRPREVLLGLALLLGVVAWALVQATTQQTQVTAYRRGLHAAAAQDWDAAAAAFATAHGYADADAQAVRARQQVVVRDQQYRAAQAAAQRGNWAQEIPAVQALQTVAPHYRDTPQLAAAVAAHAYAPALSGTFVLRTGPGVGGLYTYAPDGWQVLAGSDLRSDVRAACPAGAFLYDVAQAGATPTTHLPPTPTLAEAPLLGRRLVVAPPGGNMRQTLALAPLPYTWYQCSAQGVWNQSLGAGALAMYQAFGSTQVVTAVLPGPEWAVARIAPAGRALLLSEQTGVRPGFPTPDARIGLYLADAQGGHRQLLDDRPGVLLHADFSPDGRWVLTLLRPPDPGPADLVRTFVLLDTTGAQPPRVLLDAQSDYSENGVLGMAGQFLQRGARAGQVLLTWRTRDHQVIRIVDPAQPNRPATDVVLDFRFDELLPLGYDAGHDALLVFGKRQAAVPGTSAYRLAYIDRQNQVHTYLPPLPAGAELEGVWVRGAWLLYGAVTAAPSGGGSFVLWRQPLGPLDAPAESPGELYRTNPAGWGTGFLVFSGLAPSGAGYLLFHVGPGRLAYVTATGQLRTRSFAGTEDLELAEGIVGFSTYNYWESP